MLLCFDVLVCFAGTMAGEFSFAELVQARQNRRKRGLVQTSIVPPNVQTKVTSSRPRDPPSVQLGGLPNVGPSDASTGPVMPSVSVEVREPFIPPPAVSVPEVSSDDEPIALRRGKRPITVEHEEVPSQTRPRTSEPCLNTEETMSLPPSFHGTSVPIVPSPRTPGEDEESILFNREFALKVASSVVPIPDRQYMMSGGLQRTMNDITISAAQVCFLFCFFFFEWGMMTGLFVCGLSS